MNTDIMEGKWKQMRGQMKEWWGKLTDDDFDVISGKKDKLVGKLQERYGWAKRDAEDEVARRFRDMDEAAGTTQPAGTTRPMAAFTFGEHWYGFSFVFSLMNFSTPCGCSPGT